MTIEFKKYGFYELCYSSLVESTIFTQCNYHYSWGVSGSIMGWSSEQSVINMAKDNSSIVAAWHLKGTHKFNNSL